MKKTIWIIGAVVLVVLCIVAWLWFRKNEAGATGWKTAILEQGDIKVTVTATGTLNAVTTVQVGTQVSGIISKILVDFNDVVKEGQVIAILDTTYLAQAVEDAEASLQRAEIQVNQTKREYDRNKQLYDQRVIAQADFDEALSNYETAVSSARSAISALKRARINLRYATIIAPISGVVVSRAVDVGQTVAASFSTPTLFTIANDLTKMQVQASIDEADIGKIQVGQEVTFTVDAYDDLTFSGTVRQVRLMPVVTQNVVNYTVIIDVPNPELKLLPGMTANITVLIQEVKDVLKAPSAALKFTPPQEILEMAMKEMSDTIRPQWENRQRTQEGTPGREARAQVPDRRTGRDMRNRRMGGILWVLEGNGIVPKRVRTGLSDGSYTEVKGRTIEAGDTVITGMVSTTNPVTTQQNNPFAPQMPRSPRPGGR
jgi:HlyD family secretion protein